MAWLRDALAAYELALVFVHGQAFFALGFSIFFLARRSARLEVARGLSLLAAFGFCEALAAWIPLLFIPSNPLTATASWLRLLLLGAGYAFLLAFAMQTLAPSERQQWKRWIPAGAVLIAWLVSLSGPLLTSLPHGQIILRGEIAVRYGMALPGGLIAAWGLRRQAYHTLEPERIALIKSPIRVARVALAAFAVFGGLIGPVAPFFPAVVINQEALVQVTGIPVALLRSLCGVALTYGIVRALGIFLREIQLWVEDVEHRQALTSERERIGRELHDGIIQSIYAAGLMLEGARHSTPNEPELAQSQLARASESLNQTIQDIRRYIFDLRGELPEDDLETGLRKILRDFRVNTLLEIDFTVAGNDAHKLGAERRQHIFQIAREALANAARHAQAKRVEISLRHKTNALLLCISDDGVGLPKLPVSKGHGLRNIQERARLLEGTLDIDSVPNKGVTLTLTVPY
ncbi:MAG: sensor histidine kinase [Anaerolineae bacterium]